MKAVIAYILSTIIIGLLMLVVLGNNFFMTLFLTQNKHAINVTLAKQFIDYEKSFSIEIEYEEKTINSATNNETNEIEYMMFEKDGQKSYVAKQKQTTVEEDLKKINTYEYYYFNGVLYKFDTLYEEIDSYTVSFSDSLALISDNFQNITLQNLQTSYLNENKVKASITASTSPIYIGQKFSFESKTDTKTESSYLSLDLFGKIREVKYTSVENQINTEYGFKVYSVNKNIALKPNQNIVKIIPVPQENI